MTRSFYLGIWPYPLSIARSVRGRDTTCGGLICSRPRESVHDPVTWRLLNDKADFRGQLVNCVEGASRCDLSWRARSQIGTYRFWPCMETTIEEKHARQTVSLASGNPGAVFHYLTDPGCWSGGPVLVVALCRSWLSVLTLPAH